MSPAPFGTFNELAYHIIDVLFCMIGFLFTFYVLVIEAESKKYIFNARLFVGATCTLSLFLLYFYPFVNGLFEVPSTIPSSKQFPLSPFCFKWVAWLWYASNDF